MKSLIVACFCTTLAVLTAGCDDGVQGIKPGFPEGVSGVVPPPGMGGGGGSPKDAGALKSVTKRSPEGRVPQAAPGPGMRKGMRGKAAPAKGAGESATAPAAGEPTKSDAPKGEAADDATPKAKAPEPDGAEGKTPPAEAPKP